MAKPSFPGHVMTCKDGVTRDPGLKRELRPPSGLNKKKKSKKKGKTPVGDGTDQEDHTRAGLDRGQGI